MLKWFEDHLIAGARDWWRMWSARLLVAALALDALSLAPVMMMMPSSVRNINPLAFDVLQMVLVAAALIGRFMRQPKLEARRDATKSSPAE